MKRSDQYWMRECIKLAKRGIGNVSPNPLVGCVIVAKGRKIAEGFHERFGGPHAEVNAINAALAKNRNLHGATLYVNLEPCSHYGKTPPCVDAILRHPIARVVVGTLDPNPNVAGKGIARLRLKGIKCSVGILKKEARELNEHFFKFITDDLPFVALKAAQTSDGYIARADGSSQWITNKQSRTYVHHIRSKFDAVVIGATTVMHDDPLLTVRHLKGKDPIRVIIDGNFTVTPEKRIFTAPPKTLLYVSDAAAKTKYAKAEQLTKKGVEVIRMKEKNGRIGIQNILKDLARRNIASVLVEGGQSVFSAFLKEKSVDKVYLFTATKKFGTGLKTFGEKSVSYKKRLRSVQQFGTDELRIFEITFP